MIHNRFRLNTPNSELSENNRAYGHIFHIRIEAHELEHNGAQLLIQKTFCCLCEDLLKIVNSFHLHNIPSCFKSTVNRARRSVDWKGTFLLRK